MMLKRSVLPLLLALFGPFAALAQDQQGSPFTVADVPVDVTAQSALQARDKARTDGEQHAFQMLMERLIAKQYLNQVPKLSDDQLADLVLDYEVTSERTSAVRYIATLTFRFRPDAVRKLLSSANIPFTETQSKAVLVLPVFEQGERATLWDAPNPWRAAWGKQSLGNGLVPMRMPIGELADVQAIDAAEATKGESGPLLAIAHRYDDADVVVASATFEGSGDQRTLQINTVRYGAGFAVQSWTETVHAAAGERDADLYGRGVAAVVADVTTSWTKAAVEPPAGPSASVIALVPVTGVKDWVIVRDRLRTVPSVQHSTLLSIGREGARVQIDYQGDPQQLQAVLAQRDLVLTPGDAGADWTLSAKGASSQ
ncbi:MAG TPA: DUF2066 domain-containing protein [Stellaceae bacterium]|nr:DUF2066 domain-containing protein [Stellaceae bacterium]